MPLVQNEYGNAGHDVACCQRDSSWAEVPNSSHTDAYAHQDDIIYVEKNPYAAWDVYMRCGIAFR